MSHKNNITALLIEADKDNPDAYDKLMPQVYDVLKDIACRQISNEFQKNTYSKTDLVHEAYLKLINYDQISWKNRAHFYAIASTCMRQILIDHARKKMAEKRGGPGQDLTYVDTFMKQKKQAKNLLDIDAALEKLATFDKRMAQIVEYRYFGEMSVENTAEVLGISPSTVKRDWAKARGWLHKELSE